ncbi:MAG: hypothetical protein K2O18_08130 [Oscillospiraceae bacterium]|nr:hypothetical protein [Oscillospiraceae bacterium]
MQNEKTVKIIEAVRNMTDHEADILEVFLSGFLAGKQVSGQESRKESAISQAVRAG